MEGIIKSFIRVQRQIDDFEPVCNSFLDLEASASALVDSSSITDADRKRILDFPEPEMQTANIAATTSLSKADLLRRASESPELLTQAEIDLLKNRYWLGLTFNESITRANAGMTPGPNSVEQHEEALARLAKVRQLLHEENEAQAIKNAAATSKNRAFVSIKKDEANLWKGGRTVGSCIYPSGSRT
ncbi:hypothetical protein M426DRAFT_319172 [Hypoxylon sp. CI-4A]|nr:hypothetical protein M426DRAFT_319172 [Hypoxylon sp. CI-4A]